MSINWEAIAVVLSVISLCIVIYQEFLRGFKLYTSINQIILLIRLPGENKVLLIQDMILDDLLSDNPSRNAQIILAQHPDFQKPIDAKNRDKLLGELIEMSQQQRISYNPLPELIKHYWGDKRYTLSFLVPLVVSNSGKKCAYISSLVLVASLKKQPDKKWAFSVFVEINPITLLQRSENHKDVDRISNLFSGFSVAPGESIQINPWFVSISDAENTIISRESMTIGDYVLQVFGYDSKGKCIFSTQSVNYSVSEQQLLEIFSGSESVNYIGMEKHVADATKKVNLKEGG